MQFSLDMVGNKSCFKAMVIGPYVIIAKRPTVCHEVPCRPKKWTCREDNMYEPWVCHGAAHAVSRGRLILAWWGRNYSTNFFKKNIFWPNTWHWEIIVSQPETEPASTAVKLRNLNHWTTRLSPHNIYFRDEKLKLRDVTCPRSQWMTVNLNPDLYFIKNMRNPLK